MKKSKTLYEVIQDLRDAFSGFGNAIKESLEDDRNRIKWKKCEPDSEPVYELTEKKSIKFHPCGVESWHYGDIAHRYCAYCGRWITKEENNGSFRGNFSNTK